MGLPPVTLDKQLMQDLLELKSVAVMRLGLFLTKNITETETTLSVTFGQNSKTIRKIGQKLVDKGIINIRIADGEVWYHIHKKYFDIEDTCQNCKYKNSTVVNTTNLIICDKKGKVCGHRHRLVGHNISHSMQEHKLATLEIYDKKIGKRDIKHVDEWDYKDFIILFFEKFKENYPNLISQESHEVRKNIKQLIKIFRDAEKTHWRRLLKQYIFWTFKNYKDCNKVVTFYSMIDKKDLLKFLGTYDKKIKKVEYCDIKSLNCSFCVGNLPEGSKSCTASIVKKMQDKYN